MMLTAVVSELVLANAPMLEAPVDAFMPSPNLAHCLLVVLVGTIPWRAALDIPVSLVCNNHLMGKQHLFQLPTKNGDVRVSFWSKRASKVHNVTSENRRCHLIPESRCFELGCVPCTPPWIRVSCQKICAVDDCSTPILFWAFSLESILPFDLK